MIVDGGLGIDIYTKVFDSFIGHLIFLIPGFFSLKLVSFIKFFAVDTGCGIFYPLGLVSFNP